jgi:tellurite resistance protein
MIEPQTALVYTMVMVSAADSDMTDSEIGRIGEMVIQLPVFSGFYTEQLTAAAGRYEELRLLEMLHHTLNIERLTAAAIERAARARYATA